MIEVRLRNKTSQQELEQKVGKILTEEDYNIRLTGAAKVLKPDGKPLCVYLPGAMKAVSTEEVYQILHSLRVHTSKNRGIASGSPRIYDGAGKRAYALEVSSSIVGAIDPGGVYKYCRLTVWTGENLPKWRQLQPYLQEIAKNLKEQVPDRYANQMSEVSKTKPEWVVPGTPFSTVTVNNCVDSETQALSRTQGWVNHGALSVGEEILAFDPATGTTRWEPLLDVFVNKQYKGEMVELSARGFSAFVTPDHRWPLQAPNASQGSKSDLRMSVKRTQELPEGYWSILRSSPHEAPELARHSDAFVRLAAWYFTEGSLIRGGKSISICQSERVNPENVESIRRDLKELGALPSAVAEHRHGGKRREGLYANEYMKRGDVVSWVLTGTAVDEIINVVSGKEKIPSPEFLASLTTEQLRIFVDVCIAGDGSPEFRRFYQYHKARMSAFVAAATLAGLAPALDSTGTYCSLRQPHSRNTGARISLRSVRRNKISYTGTVWCPSLPSGHWVAMRRGTVYMTGNSYPTGVHTDKGDLDAGFSTIACIRRGEFTGGHLTFPEYRVSVNLQDGDLILMDAHEFHGNTAIVCACGNSLKTLCPDCGAERISTVAYFRTKVAKCGTFDEELARAAERREKR